MHKVVEPKILYLGTPVILLSTMNEDDTPNLAPMSSGWWLGWSCMLGMSTRSKTVDNLQKTGECVLNLPSVDLVSAIDRLALTTGRNPVPQYKQAIGYQYEADKFEVAGLTRVESHLVKPPRVVECPIQLEAEVMNIHQFGHDDEHLAGIEVRIIRVHVDVSLLVHPDSNHIDPNKWQPLIMNFCEFFGLGQQVHPSRLAKAFNPIEVVE